MKYQRKFVLLERDLLALKKPCNIFKNGINQQNTKLNNYQKVYH